MPPWSGWCHSRVECPGRTRLLERAARACDCRPDDWVKTGVGGADGGSLAGWLGGRGVSPKRHVHTYGTAPYFVGGPPPGKWGGGGGGGTGGYIWHIRARIYSCSDQIHLASPQTYLLAIPGGHPWLRAVETELQFRAAGPAGGAVEASRLAGRVWFEEEKAGLLVGVGRA